MGSKLLGTLRLTAAGALAVGVAFVGVAIIMPGEQASGTQARVDTLAPAALPERPSYIASVPKQAPVLFEADVPQVAKAQLRIDTPDIATAAAAKADPRDAYQISASALNIREEPTSQSPSLFVLDYGTKVQVADMNGSWAQITAPDGRTGWAYVKYLSRPGDSSGPGDSVSN